MFLLCAKAARFRTTPISDDIMRFRKFYGRHIPAIGGRPPAGFIIRHDARGTSESRIIRVLEIDAPHDRFLKDRVMGRTL
jgi:hypothetical protein